MTNDDRVQIPRRGQLLCGCRRGFYDPGKHIACYWCWQDRIEATGDVFRCVRCGVDFKRMSAEIIYCQTCWREIKK